MMLGDEMDGLATAGRQAQAQGVGSGHLARLDQEILATRAVVGLLAVTVDLCGVAAGRIEEVRRHLQRARRFIGHRSQVPVVAARGS